MSAIVVINMTDGYVAGLFDADGCASIVKIQGCYYALQANITNANYEVLQKVQRKFKGNIYSHTTYHAWQCYGKNAFDFFSSVQPYLWIKSEQVACCLLCKAVEVEKREELWQKVQSFKRDLTPTGKSRGHLESDYLAGFFDGDGTIVFTPGLWALAATLRVGLINKCCEMLKQIQRQFGGGISVNWSAHPHIKKLYFTADRAAEFLKEVYPYLQIKKDLAKCAIEFQKTKGNGGRLGEATKKKRRRILETVKTIKEKIVKEKKND